MPQPAFHMMLATEALERWGSSAPFDHRDVSHRNAFLNGAVAPDMGFFPGCLRMISEHAHADGAGDLVRELARVAGEPLMDAFIHGWATHVLIDAIFHPIIDHTAAQLTGCTVEDRIALQPMHIRLEMGMDLVAHAARPHLKLLRLRPFMDSRAARRVANAFMFIHGVEVMPSALLGTHRRVSRLLGPLMELQSSMLIAERGRAMRRTRMILDIVGWMARSVGGKNSETAAFLHPHMPGADLRTSIEQLTALFFRVFDRDVQAGLRNFPNYDVHRGGITGVALQQAV